VIRPYGSTNPAFTVSYSGFANGEATNVLSGAPVLTTSAETNSPVGVYTITNTMGTLVAPNYTISLVNGSLTVTGAVLTATADSKTRTYGLPNTLTVSYSGFVNGEGTNVLSGAPSLSTLANTNSPPGIYPITIGAGTLSAVNYTFVFNGGILTVVDLPQLTGVGIIGTQFVFSVPTIAGQTYTIEYKDDLAGATWNLLGSPVLGTGNLITVTNGLGASPQRFFRVQISP